MALLSAGIYDWIEKIIWLQAGLIGLLLAYTCGLLLGRAALRRYHAWRSAIYEERVVSLMIDHMDAPGKSPDFKPLPWDRSLFRRILLRHVDSVAGAERDFLIRYYERLGLLARDLREARSLRWTARLAAALRLDRLRLESTIPALRKLQTDRAELVSMSALRTLSRFPSALSPEEAQAGLSRLSRARKDAATEVLAHLVESSGHGIVSQVLRLAQDESVRESCLVVLGRLRAPGAEQAILWALEHSPTDATAVAALSALARIGDPGWSDYARAFLDAPAPRVRAAAARALIQLGAELGPELSRLFDDPAIEVQRALAGVARPGKEGAA